MYLYMDNNIEIKYKKEQESLNKNLVVYKRMQNHLLKDINILKKSYKQNESDKVLTQLNRKEQNLHGINKKIEDVENRLENLKPPPPPEPIQPREPSPFEKKIEQMHKVDKEIEEEQEEKKDIQSTLELLKLQQQKENNNIQLRKQEEMKKELEKQRLKKELLRDQKNIEQNEKILKRAAVGPSKEDEAEKLKQEIENSIYIELRKKELELKNYQETLKRDDDNKINDVICQVRNENRLQLDKYDQIFKKRDEKLRKVLNHLNSLGAQLKNLTRTKNPNNLKFVVHKTLNDHKQCVDIINSLIAGENNRYKF